MRRPHLHWLRGLVAALLLALAAGACATEDPGSSLGGDGKADGWDSGSIEIDYADYVESFARRLQVKVDSVVDGPNSPYSPDQFFKYVTSTLMPELARVKARIEAAERAGSVASEWAVTATAFLHDVSWLLDDTWELYDAFFLEWHDVLGRMQTLQDRLAAEAARVREALTGPMQGAGP